MTFVFIYFTNKSCQILSTVFMVKFKMKKNTAIKCIDITMILMDFLVLKKINLDLLFK